MKRASIAILGAFLGALAVFASDVLNGMGGKAKQLKEVYRSLGDGLGILHFRNFHNPISLFFLFLSKHVCKTGNSSFFFGFLLKGAFFSNFLYSVHDKASNFFVFLVFFRSRICKMNFPCLCGTI